MISIPLTINADYLPEWGVYEGLRELVQNWLDAADDTGVPGAIDYIGDKLMLRNYGVTLSRSALLLGTTSKAGRSDQRGHFGEGLKLGVLALVRAGCKVCVSTDNEVWRADLRANSDFGGQRLLTFDVTEFGADIDGVSVTVGGIDVNDYQRMRNAFLHFSDDSDIIETDSGRLLLGDDYRGKVYVKGIFVQAVADMAYGYDFVNVKTDRDRRLVSDFDLTWHAGQILAAALAAGSIVVGDIYAALMANKRDVRGLHYGLTSADKTDFVHLFSEEHGSGAVPCSSEWERNQLKKVGVRAVVVPATLIEIIGATTGTYATAYAAASAGPRRSISFLSLAEDEKAALRWAFDQIKAVTGLAVSTYIGDFRQDETVARHKGRVYINRLVLASRYQTLAALVKATSSLDDFKADDSGENLWPRLAAYWHGDTFAVEPVPVIDESPVGPDEIPF